MSLQEKEAEQPASPVPASEASKAQMPSFPEGGLQAWLVVTGSFCVLFCTFGYLNAYGVYQDYYQTHQLSSMSSSAISWIGSAQVFFLFAGGLIGGPLFDRLGAVVILPPSVLFIFSVMMTSLSKKYYQFMLAQGILEGLCCGIIFTPAMAAVGQYFHKRRGAAMGVVVSGSGLGGVIFPIALSKMFESNLGYGWSVRIVGFIMLGLLTIACATIRRRLPPRGGNIFVLSAFKNSKYLLCVTSLFFLVWGMFTPFFYIETYAIAQGMSPRLASYVLSIMNSASIFGRLLPGFVADRFGNFMVLTCSGAITGIVLLCWMAVHSNAGIIVFAVFYGFFSGAIISLVSPCFAQIAGKPNLIGAYLGMGMALIGFSGLTGTPICGALIDNYGWDSAMIFSGVSIFVGTVFTLVTKLTFNRNILAKA